MRSTPTPKRVFTGDFVPDGDADDLLSLLERVEHIERYLQENPTHKHSMGQGKRRTIKEPENPDDKW